jgi:hypothetical protein
MNYIIIPEYLDSKMATVILTKGTAITWWFVLHSGQVLIIDYIPENWPQLLIATFNSRKEAIERLIEMTSNEGWTIARDYLLKERP